MWKTERKTMNVALSKKKIRIQKEGILIVQFLERKAFRQLTKGENCGSEDKNKFLRFT